MNDISEGQLGAVLANIRVVLVCTTHPGNIGAVARAMKTMGLSALYLVQPKIFPGAEATEFESEMVESDLVLLSRNADGRLVSRLTLPDGKDSVAKRNPLAIRKN